MAGTDPTVSVVVPTYRRNERLRAALDSVERQSYAPLEVVVVDGADGAGARPVVEAYDARYLRQRDHQETAVSGVRAAADARDIGVDASTGAYVRFLDDDDRLREDAIAEQVRVLEADAGVGVVYCGIEREGGHVTLPNTAARGDVLEHALRLQVPPCVPSTMLVDRRCLDRIPPMRTLPHDDAAVRIELAQITAFDFVDEPLVFRGTSEDALAGSPSSVAGRKATVEAYGDLYDRFPPEVRGTALMRTYVQEGRLRLSRRLWSPGAMKAFALANYHAPDVRPEVVGTFLASLFGRPGWRLGVAAYDALAGGRRRGVAGDGL